MDIEELRKRIDEVDEKLIELFEERMSIVLEIAEYKRKNGKNVYDAEREALVIKKGLDRLKNLSLSESTEKFLGTLMKISREAQDKIMLECGRFPEGTKIKAGFPGISGSFSEQALINYFGDNVDAVAIREFEGVFTELRAGNIDYGILPIENSSTGSVTDVYDLLNKYDFKIVGETCMKIDQHLLTVKGTKLSDIKEVYSHPQGLMQCSDYLKKHAWQEFQLSNTSISAEYVASCGDKSKAAIGSSRAAELYGLEILAQNINFNSTSTTRFILIGRDIESDSYSNKISIVFSAAHKPGTLYGVLRNFALNNLNLLKIESRPIQVKPWEYIFYVDFEGNLSDIKVKEAMDAVGKESTWFKILGNYRRYC